MSAWPATIVNTVRLRDSCPASDANAVLSPGPTLTTRDHRGGGRITRNREDAGQRGADEDSCVVQISSG
jgi:hypothetical protein